MIPRSAIFLLIVVCAVAYSQTPAALYLKNGKVLFGSYDVAFKRKNIAFQVKDSTYTIPTDSISSIKLDPETKTEKRKMYGVLKGGYNSLGNALGVSVSAGFWLNRNIKLGAGLELYKSLDQQEKNKIYLSEYMPIFGEVRFEFNSAKAVPYLMLQTGFGYVVRNQLDNFELTPEGITTRTKQGSLCGGIYGGFKYKIKNGWHWFWEAGGKLQGYNTKTTMYDNGIKTIVDNTENSVFVNVNVGWMW